MEVNDFIKDCMVDIDAAFKKNSLKVTDLDKNGIAEIWVMYEMACKGDVSPSDLKIIMYEGKQNSPCVENPKYEPEWKTTENQYLKADLIPLIRRFNKVQKLSEIMLKNYGMNTWQNNLALFFQLNQKSIHLINQLNNNLKKL
jgi:hypothetical protein